MDDYTESLITDEGAFKMEKTDNELSKNEVRTVILEKINGISEEKMRQLLKYLDEEQIPEQRKYDRKDFIRIIDYTVGDRYYRDFIQDMSNSGVFIKTSQTFSEGQMILMTFMSPDNQQPFKINGEIVRVMPNGIGVKFKTESQVQESVLKSYVNMIKRS